MNLKELGTTGVQVPEIGLGTWRYRGGVEPLRKGISLGAFLIDTAEMYGTEGAVGEAIKDRRDQVFLATKVSGDHLRYDEVLRAAEGSLRRLGTSYIDLYQIHWPDPRAPIRETMRAIEALVEAGKVRFIGVSNFSVGELQKAQVAMGRDRIVSNQVLYNFFEREIEEDLLPYCEEQRITVMAYTPLAKGRLAAKSALRHKRAMEALQNIAREMGKTVAQVALNWCISRPTVIVIPKTDSVNHVIENCGASGWRLSAEHLEVLNRAFR